jgi:hypothetical protein
MKKTRPADYLVDVLDHSGRVIGQKRRQDIDKRVDIFHSVHVVLVTPEGEAVLSIIPERDDLPNLYANLLGTTMATIRRYDETAEEAVRRGLDTELLIGDAKLTQVRDGMITLSDGRPVWLTAFVMTADRPELYQNLHVGELLLIEPEGVDVAMVVHSDRFAPTLKAIWPSLRAYKSRP